jgi:hypothetical protein
MPDDNPYSPPQTRPEAFPISPASRLRRRLLAVGLIGLGMLLFLLRSYRPISATLMGPGLMLLGLAALVSPVALPDPKREFGMMQLWIDTSRKGFWLGPAALLIGAAIGIALLLWGV